jgi:hypothetical protein
MKLGAIWWFVNPGLCLGATAPSIRRSRRCGRERSLSIVATATRWRAVSALTFIAARREFGLKRWVLWRRFAFYLVEVTRWEFA